VNQYISLKIDALEQLSKARLKAKDARNEMERAEALTLYDRAIERLQELAVLDRPHRPLQKAQISHEFMTRSDRT